MTRTIPGPGHEPGGKPDRVRPASATTRRSTWGERAIVLGGFAVAALWTAASLLLDTGMETVGAAWTIAIAWAVVCSLSLALRRGIRARDWSAFRRYRLSGNGGLIDLVDEIRRLRLPARRRGAPTPDARGLSPPAIAGPASRR